MTLIGRKKLSNFSHSEDWARDSNNFVAKSYMEENTPREMYFDDVKLQMDAKLWSEEYNRHQPPKQVDIFMMAVIELFERPGCPLYHVEHYIDGEYIKYNSNSGFVADCRQTPQAFSHFTFECSGHELIVVDIQGCGDLYTDPQIHTLQGTEYGDGNLGVKVICLGSQLSYLLYLFCGPIFLYPSFSFGFRAWLCSSTLTPATPSASVWDSRRSPCPEVKRRS